MIHVSHAKDIYIYNCNLFVKLRIIASFSSARLAIGLLNCGLCESNAWDKHKPTKAKETLAQKKSWPRCLTVCRLAENFFLKCSWRFVETPRHPLNSIQLQSNSHHDNKLLSSCGGYSAKSKPPGAEKPQRHGLRHGPWKLMKNRPVTSQNGTDGESADSPGPAILLVEGR